LAVAAQVPILPIAHDAGSCWPAHRFIKHAGTITVHIGEPIETHSHSPKELTSMAQVWCSSALRADALSDI
jgi:1-acyl-sn-glycerol-3-phosphate acyltransferase